MTVDIDPPATVTRLVIGAWLQQSISVLLIDPDEDSRENGEVRKLSRWSPEEVSRFAAAKRLTYIGDNFGASQVTSNLMRAEEDRPVFEQTRLTSIETDRGLFVGSAQQHVTADGHRLEMFRGVQHTLLDLLYHGRAVAKQLEASHEISGGAGSFVETGAADGSAFVRSFTRDGSLFEVRILE
jgi:hypothetical protein